MNLESHPTNRLSGEVTCPGDKSISQRILIIGSLLNCNITISGFLYQTSLNYIALIGLTYIICRETKLTKNIYKGWSLGFVMLLITYLLPSQIITYFMNIIEKYLNNYKEGSLLCLECKRIYILIFGLLLILLIILLEKYIIVKFRKYLIKTGKFVINLPF